MCARQQDTGDTFECYEMTDEMYERKQINYHTGDVIGVRSKRYTYTHIQYTHARTRTHAHTHTKKITDKHQYRQTVKRDMVTGLD